MEDMVVEIASVSPEVWQSFEEFYHIGELLPEMLGAIYIIGFIIVGVSVAFAVLKGCRGW